jgi:hypothetical protein
MTGALIAPPQQFADLPQPDPRSVYRCECGQVLRVSGGGRHRVYFHLSNEGYDDPVMNRVCPACERGLPGKSAPASPEHRS